MLDIKKFLKGLRILNSNDQTKAVETTVSDTATTNTKLTLVAKQNKNTTLEFPNTPAMVTTDELVTVQSEQTFKNKKLDDSTTAIVDSTDPSKTITFDAAGTPSTTTTLRAQQSANRILDLPDASDVLVARNTVDNLTNKTLTDPTINGGSINNVNSITTTGDVTVGGNLTVNGTTTSVNTDDLNVEDKNITVNFGGNDASSEGAGLTVARTGTPGSLIYKDASASKFAAGALGSESDIVTTLATQTIENKTFIDPVAEAYVLDEIPVTPATPAPGQYKIYAKPDGFAYFLDDNGVETLLGNDGNISFGFQEVLAGTVDGINDTFGPLTQDVLDGNSAAVSVDGLFILNDKYNINTIMGQKYVVFTPGNIPVAGQIIEAFYLYRAADPGGGGGGGGSVNPANSPPLDISSVASVGTSLEYAREDHVHRGTRSIAKSGSPQLYGDITVSEGSKITLTQTLQDISIATTAAEVGSAPPANVGSAAVVGVSTLASRQDHVHRGVHSISKSGSASLFGDVTLSEGSNITLVQSGNNIEITAGGTVGASYRLGANFSASPTIPVNYNIVEYDTHSAVTVSPTAWRFTAPSTGKYHISGPQNAGAGAGAHLFKNGVQYKGAGAFSYAAGITGMINVTLNLNAGDFIDLRPHVAVTVIGGALNSYLTSNITITKVGN